MTNGDLEGAGSVPEATAGAAEEGVDDFNKGSYPSDPLESRTLTPNNSQTPHLGGSHCLCTSCTLEGALAPAEAAGSPFLSREPRRAVCMFALVYYKGYYKVESLA